MSFIAVDVGGTKIDLGCFDGSAQLTERRQLRTADYPDLYKVIQSFLGGRSPSGVGIAIGGPVTSRREQLTNLDWEVDADAIQRALDRPVFLVNDMAAHSYGAISAPPSLSQSLQAGTQRTSSFAVIAPGSGLGQAMVIRDGDRLIAHPCEGGHSSFAPTNDEELELLHYARKSFDHVSAERVISGNLGMPLLLDFFIHTGRIPSEDLATFIELRSSSSVGAAIHRLAEDGSKPADQILCMFVRMLGSESANLVLKAMALGGLFICGALPSKLSRWMLHPSFREGFLCKGRYRELLSQVSIRMIIDDANALRGIHHIWTTR
jgi:glucokinase